MRMRSTPRWLRQTPASVSRDVYKRQALPHAATASGAPLAGGTLAARTEAYEREVILAELKRHQRMTDTAKALGLERSHLYKKCQQLGIDLRALRTEPRA